MAKKWKYLFQECLRVMMPNTSEVFDFFNF